MTTAIILALVVAAVTALLISRGKGSTPSAVAPKPVVPTGPVHDVRVKFPKDEAWQWMYNYAPGGQVFDVTGTGSMVPYFDGSEFIVVASNYAGIKLGDVVAYRTVGGTAPAIGSMLIHRIVDGNAATGWIPKGDTPGNPIEDWNPITPANYVGTLVAVFRQASN